MAASEASDGGLILYGHTYGTDPVYHDPVYAKFSSTGDLEWARYISSPGRGGSSHVVEIPAVPFNHYYFSGSSASDTEGPQSPMVIKFNSIGQYVWGRSLSINAGLIGFEVTQDQNALIVSGFEYLAGNDGIIAKISLDGDLIWVKSIGGPGVDVIRHVKKTPDGNYIAVGNSDSFTSDDACFLVKFDSDGTLLYSKIINGIGYEYFYAPVILSDGSIVISGRTYTYGAGEARLYLLKFEDDGTLIWARTLGNGGEEFGYSVVTRNRANKIIIQQQQKM